jgi:hypothetical protein
MRLTWGLLAFLEGAAAVDTYVAVAARKCVNSVGCEGYYRGFVASTSPANSAFVPVSNVTGISVAAIGAQAATTTGGVVRANLDVGGFRFKTPADTSDGNNALSFYFGYLGVAGTWDPTTKTGAMVGALAEVVSTLSSINVWYENDGVTGFKWDVTQADITKRWDVYNPAEGEAKGYDAFDPKGGLELKNLTWTAIGHSKIKCNSIAALMSAPDGCEIHSLTTSGSHNSAPGVPVITFTARFASQPVLINNVLHGPEFAKFDVTVAFPWAYFEPDLYSVAKAKLALIAFAAGKSATFAGAARRNTDGSDSLVFAAQGGAVSSYYSFTATATIDGVAGSVTTQVITGQQILDFQCPAGSPCFGVLGVTATNIVAALLKISVNWLQAFGWKSSVVVHALGTTNKPLNVFWDPAVGSDSTANSAALAVPSLVFLLGLMLH